ncbi:15351_t:CDS:2, partial [Acaulospora morrowiae]
PASDPFWVVLSCNLKEKLPASSHMLVSKIKSVIQYITTWITVVILVPAAAVIPAPIAYIKVIAVIKLVVEFRDLSVSRASLITVMINRDSWGESICQGLIKNESWGSKTIRYRLFGFRGGMVARLKLKGIGGRAPPGLFLDSMGSGAWPFLVGGSLFREGRNFLEGLSAFSRWKFEAITGIPSKRESSTHVDYVPALCTHRPSLLPIEWLSETLESGFRNRQRILSSEKFVKLGHLEEVKVVTRFP